MQQRLERAGLVLPLNILSDCEVSLSMLAVARSLRGLAPVGRVTGVFSDYFIASGQQNDQSVYFYSINGRDWLELPAPTPAAVAALAAVGYDLRSCAMFTGRPDTVLKRKHLYSTYSEYAELEPEDEEEEEENEGAEEKGNEDSDNEYDDQPSTPPAPAAPAPTTKPTEQLRLAQLIHTIFPLLPLSLEAAHVNGRVRLDWEGASVAGLGAAVGAPAESRVSLQPGAQGVVVSHLEWPGLQRRYEQGRLSVEPTVYDGNGLYNEMGVFEMSVNK